MDMISGTNSNPSMPSSTSSMASLVKSNTDASAPMDRNQIAASQPAASQPAFLDFNSLLQQLMGGG